MLSDNILIADKMSTFLNDEERTICDSVNLICICGSIGAIGISGNIINMIIFYKQGFTNTVNIGFFGLAASDIICLFTLQMAAVFLNPLFMSSGIPWDPLETYYLLAAWPHICFSRITSCITVYITAERYLSIALPLKVKQMVTPKTALLSTCLIYLANIITVVPEYSTSYLGWRYFSKKNKTLLGILFTSDRKSVQGVVYILNFILGLLSFVGVITFTMLLASKLKQSYQRRKAITSNISTDKARTSRDDRTVKMVVLIAIIFIICYSPSAMVSLGTFIAGPEYTIRGKYVNLCEALWTIAYIFHTVNSSVNILVYYSMSTKYKDTFNEVFRTCRRGNVDEHSTN